MARSKKTAKRSAKKSASKSSKKLSDLKPHLHASPVCSGSTHDPSCEGKGREVVCVEISASGIKMCACVHRKA